MPSMKTIMVILMTIIFSLLFISQSSHAEIYKWVDEEGIVHFADDPATIPEKYREKMTREEAMRAKQKYEEEITEQLKREKKEYDAKELEKRVKEIMEKTQKPRGKCEIISYSQYDVIKDVHASGGGGGHVIPGTNIVSGDSVNVWASKSTCVDLVIKNNDREPKTITERNIVATTSREVVTKWNLPSRGSRSKPTPAETKTEFNPMAFFIKIGPGETYRGSICFHRQLPISKLELQGL
jgi:hypothetical protein